MNSPNSKSKSPVSEKKNFEEYYNMDSKIGKIILIFFILTTIFWIVLYTFNPSIVQGPESSRKYLIK
jgi:O-antigen/teichoic acid export membrane protein